MKGLYLKRGWYYWQPPTPKGGGIRPSGIALKTQDIVEATQMAVDLSGKTTLENIISRHSYKDTVGRYIQWTEVTGRQSEGTREASRKALLLIGGLIDNPAINSIEEKTAKQLESTLREGDALQTVPSGKNKGMRFLIVALECKPRDEVLAWANQVVAKHPDRRVIVLTHAYMDAKKSRNTGGMKAKGNTGEQTWQKFVKKHKNIFMVLCGHHTGEAVRTDAGDHGNPVHQILSDYQHLNNGGESWLRYMVFKPEANKISIYTYNPALDKFKNGPSSRFDLDYPMTLPLKARAANDQDNK